jgi:hypothetical protein
MTDDSSKIPMPKDPQARELLTRVMTRDKEIFAAASSNKNDYRNLLHYAQDDTDDFLRYTVKGPYYDRSSNVLSYQSGGWL